MAKTNSLLAKLRQDFPAIRFEIGDDFYWSSATSTIFTPVPNGQSEELTLLHEVAHALLGHQRFTRDINLIKLEREAWDHVRDTLAPQYGLVTRDDDIEDMLDTYREWLHARSTCPQCSLTGIQTDSSLYHCLGCGNDWRVNDARRCELRRYSLATT